MDYYKYDPAANNYAGIMCGEDDNENITDIHYSASPLLPSWKPISFIGFDDNPPVEGDFPSLSNFRRIPVMSEHAWNTLQPLIGYCCEALPIKHYTGEPYFIIHVMETIDCLDEEKSEVFRFTDGGIMKVECYSFKEGLLLNKHIFKLPRANGADLLLSEEFRQMIEKNNLKGLDFISPIPMVSL